MEDVPELGGMEPQRVIGMEKMFVPLRVISILGGSLKRFQVDKKTGASQGTGFLKIEAGRALLLMIDASKLLQAESVESDEARGVVLVVGFFLTTFHGGDVFVIKAIGRAPSCVHDVAFV